jgi:hypothetical protein
MELDEKTRDKLKIFHIKVLDTTLDVIKRNIDKGIIKNQTYVVTQDDIPIYVYVKGHEYEKVLEQIKKHYINMERYEDCSEIVEYQHKIKQLHYEPNTRTVESEL